jgi:hypothetical protein
MCLACEGRPDDDELIRRYHSKRQEYQRLRDMLLSDRLIEVYARLGVETSASGRAVPPSEAGLAAARYQEYVALLDSIGAKSVLLRRDKTPAVCVQMWATGFGGSTRHMQLCSVQAKPEVEVPSLAEFFKAHRRGPVFRHIEGDWYLWAD